MTRYCKNGHRRTLENTGFRSKGASVYCKLCHRITCRNYYLRNAGAERKRSRRNRAKLKICSGN